MKQMSLADTGWALKREEPRTISLGPCGERPRMRGLELAPRPTAWRAHLPYLHRGHDQWITQEAYASRGNPNPSHHFSRYRSQNKKREILPPDEKKSSA